MSKCELNKTKQAGEASNKLRSDNRAAATYRVAKGGTWYKYNIAIYRYQNSLV